MARRFYKEINQAFPSIVFEVAKPDGFALITDDIELHKLHEQKYRDKKKEGEDYHIAIQADMYLKILSGTYTPVEAFAFESHTSTLSHQIVSGSWLTAQSVCAALPESGIFDTVKKQEIQDYIDNYVTDNY